MVKVFCEDLSCCYRLFSVSVIMFEVRGIVDCLHGLGVKRMQIREISGFSCRVVESVAVLGS